LKEDVGRPNPKDTYIPTPLWWAARNGHDALVKLPFAKDGVDLNFKDTECSLTPPPWAARKRHNPPVRLPHSLRIAPHQESQISTLVTAEKSVMQEISKFVRGASQTGFAGVGMRYWRSFC
jgi:hypothetical protein